MLVTNRDGVHVVNTARAERTAVEIAAERETVVRELILTATGTRVLAPRRRGCCCVTAAAMATELSLRRGSDLCASNSESAEKLVFPRLPRQMHGSRRFQWSQIAVSMAA